MPVGYFDEVSPAGNFERQKRFTPFTAVYNVTGQPAVSLPLHWSAEGLPIGVMLAGRHGRGGHFDLPVRAAGGGPSLAGPAPAAVVIFDLTDPPSCPPPRSHGPVRSAASRTCWMPMIVAAPLMSPLAIRPGISASGTQRTASVSFASGTPAGSAPRAR